MVDAAGTGETSTVKSAARVLAVFEFFDDIQRPARAGEIAERLAMPQSSTSVLLRSLVTLGYLDHDLASRTFLPSPRVGLLGMWLTTQPARAGRLARLMTALSEATGDTIIVAARNGIHAHYLHVVPARSSLRFHVPQGTRRLLARSATGYALLSRVPDEEIATLVRRTNAEAGAGRPRTELADTLAGVEQVRRDGYFVSRGLVTDGAGSIAMPLPVGVDRFARPMAIANSGLLQAIESREYAIIGEIKHLITRHVGIETSDIVS